MAKYFSKFPVTTYQLYDTNSEQLVTNILSRYVVEKNIRENMVFYDAYTVRDGDTPENIAHKFYGSSERHWLILSVNNILDTETQWPLSEEQLNKYINDKYSIYGDGSEYGGLEYAKNNTHSYYKVEKIVAPNGVETVSRFEVDANTFSELSVTSNTVNAFNSIVTVINTTETKSFYLYEQEENDAKRQIKLLRVLYADTVEKELERVFLEE